MTATRTVPVIEGPLKTGRWGSVGFRLNDPQAPAMCREALATMLEQFRLSNLRNGMGDYLRDDLPVILTELVTNAQRYGGDAFPAGSFTLFHPGRWLHLTVHDKNPYRPTKEARIARTHPYQGWEETGRGLMVVQKLAEPHFGHLWYHSDGDKETPGKVAHVAMLLPNLLWSHVYQCPFTGKTRAGTDR
ncbi:ATP-binding protein [Streptomyces albidoflavus]